MADESKSIKTLKIEEQDIIAVEEETVLSIDNPHESTRTVGMALIGVGAVLLAFNVVGALFGVSVVQWVWPLWFIAPGLLMLWPAYAMRPGEQPTWAWLAIPGAVLTTLGGMFAVMSVFDHFEAWAYAWALLPVAVLWSILYINRHSADESEVQGIKSAIRILFWIMLGLGAFFELLIFNNMLGVLWPVLFIAGGVYLIIKNRRATVV